MVSKQAVKVGKAELGRKKKLGHESVTLFRQGCDLPQLLVESVKFNKVYYLVVS